VRKAGIALMIAGAIGIVAAVVWFSGDDGDSGNGGTSAPFRLAPTTPASAPFASLTATQLGVGGRCLHVVVADDTAERVQGLRQRSDIGPYDGMLFVFDAPTATSFTMSTVPVGLDIGFYGADGSPVSRRHMKPCPSAEADCPDYHAGGPFTYALETLTGKLPSGALSGCN
jgi:uncharacterized membrane protein (UPF0127 family)